MCFSCLSRCAKRLWSEEELSPCHCATDERETPGYQPIPEDVVDREEECAPLCDQITTRDVELMTLGVDFIVKRHRKVFRMPPAADPWEIPGLGEDALEAHIRLQIRKGILKPSPTACPPS